MLDAGPAAATPVANPPVISFVAGTGTGGAPAASGTPATSSRLCFPRQMAMATNGDLRIADSANARVEKIDPAGTMTYVAGTGRGDLRATDGQPATTQPLYEPWGPAIDPTTGDLIVADTMDNAVRCINSSTGIVTRIAGDASDASGAATSGSAIDSRLNQPRGLAIDADGNIYIADSRNNRVVTIDHATGDLSVVAGTGALASTPPTRAPPPPRQ